MRRTLSQSLSHGLRFAAHIGIALLVLSLVAGCERASRQPLERMPEKSEDFDALAAQFTWPEQPSHVIALEVTGRGTIRIGLYDQVAPKTVHHIVSLVTRGVYDDTLFHRVIEDFMIQGGNPATRKRGPDSTRGDWGDLSVEDEFQPVPQDRGVVSMANRGRPGSANSQFFIVQRDSHHLDGNYTAFGRVISGMDVVDGIAAVETDLHGRWGDKNKPLENVILERAVLERGSLAGEPAEAPADESA